MRQFSFSFILIFIILKLNETKKSCSTNSSTTSTFNQIFINNLFHQMRNKIAKFYIFMMSGIMIVKAINFLRWLKDNCAKGKWLTFVGFECGSRLWFSYDFILIDISKVHCRKFLRLLDRNPWILNSKKEINS